MTTDHSTAPLGAARTEARVGSAHRPARLAALSFLSAVLDRAFGLALIVVIATVFGAGAATDAYFLALSFTVILGSTVANALYTALVPALSTHAPEAPSFSSAVRVTLVASGAATAAFVVIVALFADFTEIWIALAPTMVTWPLGGVFAALLVARRRYFLAAMRIAMASGLTLVVIAVLLPVFSEVIIIAIAVTVGQLLVVSFVAVAIGRQTSCANPRQPNSWIPFLRSAAAAFGATLVSGPIVLVLERVLAIGLGAGSVSVLAFARGLALLPLMFSQAVSSGLFARMADRRGGDAGAARLAVGSLRIALVAAAVAFGYLAVFRHELVEVAFAHGALRADEARATAELVYIFSFALPGLAATAVAAPAAFAIGQRRLAVAANVVGIVLYIAAAIDLRSAFGTDGLAVAVGASSTVTGFILAVSIGRGLSVSAATMAREWLIVPFLVGGAFASVAYGVKAATDIEDRSFPTIVAVLAIAGCAGVAATFGSILPRRRELIRRA